MTSTLNTANANYTLLLDYFNALRQLSVSFGLADAAPRENARFLEGISDLQTQVNAAFAMEEQVGGGGLQSSDSSSRFPSPPPFDGDQSTGASAYNGNQANPRSHINASANAREPREHAAQGRHNESIVRAKSA